MNSIDNNFSALLDIPEPTLGARPSERESELFVRANQITIPAGALDSLIQKVLRITSCKNIPKLNAEAYVFAGDHEVAQAHPVSAYPTEITRLMVANFLSGGAAMSVLCHLRNCPLTVVNVGVSLPELVLGRPREDAKIRYEDWTPPRKNLDSIERSPAWGETDSIAFSRSYPHGAKNIVDNSAIDENHFKILFQHARREIGKRTKEQGLNVILLGEMGIGNSTPAAALACWSFGLEPSDAVGQGTGISHSQWNLKRDCVQMALNRHRILQERLDNVLNEKLNLTRAVHKTAWVRSLAALSSLGGFELAAMAGAFVGAVENDCRVLLDGAICTAAIAPLLLVFPEMKNWVIAGHQSSEPSHQFMLERLELVPLLKLDLRLGEGSGAALALGLLQDTQQLILKMATFNDLAVSAKH